MRESLQHLTKKQKRRFGILTFAVLILFSGAVIAWIGVPMLRLLEDPEAFRTQVNELGIAGRLLFIAMSVFQVVFAVVPGEPFEVGAGYAFGAIEGTLLCILSTTLGGALVFLLVKRFGIRFVEIFFPIEKIRSLWFLRTEKRRNRITFLVFLIPGTPKDLLCYFVGLTDMKLGTWILISSIARLPSIVTSTVGGDALGTRRYWQAILVLAITALISGFGFLLYKRIIKPRRTKKETLCPSHEKETSHVCKSNSRISEAAERTDEHVRDLSDQSGDAQGG